MPSRSHNSMRPTLYYSAQLFISELNKWETIHKMFKTYHEGLWAAGALIWAVVGADPLIRLLSCCGGNCSVQGETSRLS